MKILGIDAMNIRDGGGLTHLREILTHATAETILFDQIIIWGNENCLLQLPNQPWIRKVNPLSVNSSGLRTTLWQIFSLGNAARKFKCSLLFIAGGSALTHFHPKVTICHNMLPFTDTALQLYPSGIRKIKFYLLRLIQLYTFRRANGIIFLSNWASDIILPKINRAHTQSIIISHGINSHFNYPERIHRSIEECSTNNPFTLLYVSRIESYKNQLQVIDAFYKLCIETNWPLKLQLIGMASDIQYEKLVKNKIKTLNSSGILVEYLGSIPYNQVHNYYHKADLGIFGSSCENMPIILLEKMAAGLPVICNDAAPMHDFLLYDGIYVDFFDVTSVVFKLKELIKNYNLRCYLSSKSIQNSDIYKWKNTSNKTFEFLYKILDKG